MQCPNCGSQLTGNEEFCGGCGKKVDHTAFCTHCGNKYERGALFCPSCGTSLTGNSTGGTQNTPQTSGITFEKIMSALVDGFRRMFDFKGRSTRLEFYSFILLVTFIDIMVEATVGPSLFYDKLSLLATIAISIRRMRDSGQHIGLAIGVHIISALDSMWNRNSMALYYNPEGVTIVSAVAGIVFLVLAAKKSIPEK